MPVVQIRFAEFPFEVLFLPFDHEFVCNQNEGQHAQEYPTGVERESNPDRGDCESQIDRIAGIPIGAVRDDAGCGLPGFDTGLRLLELPSAVDVQTDAEQDQGARKRGARCGPKGRRQNEPVPDPIQAPARK